MALNQLYLVKKSRQTARVCVDHVKDQDNIKQLKKRYVMLFSGLALLCLMSSLSFAGDTKVNSVNLYEKNYKEQNPQQLKSLSPNPDTKMYVSNHKDEDNISMLESGYDLMGSSGFTAQDVPADFALQHAKKIKADTVLVYSKYGSAKTKQSKMAFIKEKAKKSGGEIDAKDLEEQDTEYDYYASYWAKVPMPLFGVHIVKLNMVSQDPETDEIKKVAQKGLKILAVIKESPAAKAAILKGDDLLKMGEADINKPDDLFAAVKRYQGQTIPVIVKRGEQEMTMSVTLNARK
jgi:hypothetical protein